MGSIKKSYNFISPHVGRMKDSSGDHFEDHNGCDNADRPHSYPGGPFTYGIYDFQKNTDQPVLLLLDFPSTSLIREVEGQKFNQFWGKRLDFGQTQRVIAIL